MTAVYLLLIFLIVIPLALVIWCAATEAALMKDRPQLSWLLPAGAVLASALGKRGLDSSSDLTALLWTLPAFYGRCVLAGTAGGASIGAVWRWFGEPPQNQPDKVS